MSLIFGGGTAIGFEVGQRTLRAALVKRGGGRLRLDWKGERGLPEGTLTDSLTEPNITDTRSFAEAVRGLARQSGYRGKTVGVALPDYVSRVAILDFDNLPGKRAETEQMLRWRLKKLLPFDADQAALRHQYLGRFTVKDKETHRFLTAIIKSDILEQYERAFTDAGLRPVVMETASFAVWNLYHDVVAAGASGTPNFALMNISGGKLTVMVFDRGVPHFLRLKDMGKFEHLESTGEGITVTRLLRELNASLTYYRENYADTPMGKVFLTGDFGQLDEMAVEIRENSDAEPVVLELSGAVQPGREAVKSGPALRPFSAACGAALEQ
jgi:Tfp pilus assembly PilM family ATPase